MKKVILIWLLKVFTSFEGDKAKEISCEEVRDDWDNSIGPIKTCFTQRTVAINELGTTVSNLDVTIKGLTFQSYRFYFLPDNVTENFPDLLVYRANDCSIKAISKRFFRGLTKLKILHLGSNKIEKISTDTFEDLAELKELFLCKFYFIYAIFGFTKKIVSGFNKIQSMSSEIFRSLNKLKKVELEKNICISENFEGPQQIAQLEETVIEKCVTQEMRMTELKSSMEKTATTITRLESQIASLNKKVEVLMENNSQG